MAELLLRLAMFAGVYICEKVKEKPKAVIHHWTVAARGLLYSKIFDSAVNSSQLDFGHKKVLNFIFIHIV